MKKWSKYTNHKVNLAFIVTSGYNISHTDYANVIYAIKNVIEYSQYEDAIEHLAAINLGTYKNNSKYPKTLTSNCQPKRYKELVLSVLEQRLKPGSFLDTDSLQNLVNDSQNRLLTYLLFQDCVIFTSPDDIFKDPAKDKDDFKILNRLTTKANELVIINYSNDHRLIDLIRAKEVPNMNKQLDHLCNISDTYVLHINDLKDFMAEFTKFNISPRLLNPQKSLNGKVSSYKYH